MRGILPWLGVAGSLAILAALNWYLGVTAPDISLIENGGVPVADKSLAPAGKIDSRTVPLVQAKTRPLFEKTRRPWTAPLAQSELPAADVAAAQIEVPLPEVPAAEEPMDARLIGIQRSPSSAMVLITDASGTTGDWFKSGSTFREWTIGEVTSNSVTLENAGKTFKLELYPSSAPDAAAP